MNRRRKAARAAAASRAIPSASPSDRAGEPSARRSPRPCARYAVPTSSRLVWASEGEPVAVPTTVADAADLVGLEEPQVATHRVVLPLDDAEVPGLLVERPRHEHAGVRPAGVAGAGDADPGRDVGIGARRQLGVRQVDQPLLEQRRRVAEEQRARRHRRGVGRPAEALVALGAVGRDARRGRRATPRRRSGGSGSRAHPSIANDPDRRPHRADRACRRAGRIEA